MSRFKPSALKVGDYVWVRNEDVMNDDIRWLFLVVFRHTEQGKQYLLATKCDWKTGKPMLQHEVTAWFNARGRSTCPEMHGDFEWKMYAKRGMDKRQEPPK